MRAHGRVEEEQGGDASTSRREGKKGDIGRLWGSGVEIWVAGQQG
jgi:hypothetical protein